MALTGLSDTNKIPNLALVEVKLGQGQAAGNSQAKPAVLVGNKLASGSAVAGTLYGPDTAVPVSSEEDVIALFGVGSDLHQMFRQFTSVNKVTALYFCPVAEGGSAAAATGTLTATGTATANGTLKVFVGSQEVQVSIVTGDTPTVVAASIAAAVNGRARAAAGATSSAGVATLTAKTKGTKGNSLKLGTAMVGATGVSVAASGAVLSGGTVDDNISDALTRLSGEYFPYVVSSSDDAANALLLKNFILSEALPMSGNRMSAYIGHIGSLATGITKSTSANYFRLELPMQLDSDFSSGEVAAYAAGFYALKEANFSVESLNVSRNGERGGDEWQLPAPRSQAKLTPIQLDSALNSGLSVIHPIKGGSSMIVRRITSQYLNGAIKDFRAMDAAKRLVSDEFAARIVQSFVADFSGKMVADDPVDQEDLVVGQVSPRLVKSSLFSLIDEFASKGFLQNVEAIKAGSSVVRDISVPTRFNVVCPLQVADILAQMATEVRESSRG